jgi:hypothetical protein
VLNVDKHFSVGDMSDLLTAKQFRFQIVSSTKSFVVYSDNAVDKQAWLTDLNKCIELCRQSSTAHDSKSAVRPIWQQDHESNNCRLCDNSFSFLNRRHHCRRWYIHFLCVWSENFKRVNSTTFSLFCSGILCCGSCSQGRLALVAGGALERHCDTCRSELENAPAQPTKHVETSEVTESRTANRGNSFASSVQSFSEQLPPTESLILQQNPMHLTVRDDEVLIAGVESDDDDQEPAEIVRRQSVTAPPPSTTAGSAHQLDTVTEEEQFPIEVFAKVDFEGDEESVEDGSELHYQIADTIMVTAKVCFHMFHIRCSDFESDTSYLALFFIRMKAVGGSARTCAPNLLAGFARITLSPRSFTFALHLWQWLNKRHRKMLLLPRRLSLSLRKRLTMDLPSKQLLRMQPLKRLLLIR